MTDLAEGAVFAGRYRVVRRLASGGMGAVYEAVHLETERRRALKVMHPHLFQSDELRDRFKREARIAAQVESEHIVDVSDAGVDEATRMPFLVMELLRGEDLGERLARAGRLPPREVATYFQQTALALDKTHALAIVHRDLKPENLFLTQREDGSPRIKILDFGIAKLVREGATASGATQSLGTPLYMAPEQFRIGAKLTSLADIHALGMMAYTLLVGHPYWHREAEGAADVIAFAMVAARGPEEPATHRAALWGVTLPPGFDTWFAKATAVNPADRFRTAGEAARVLGEVLGSGAGAVTAALPALPLGPGANAPCAPSMGQTATSAPTGQTATSAAVTVAGEKRSRRPLLGATLGALALCLCGLGAWWTWGKPIESAASSAPPPVSAIAPVATASVTPAPASATAPAADAGETRSSAQRADAAPSASAAAPIAQPPVPEKQRESAGPRAGAAPPRPPPVPAIKKPAVKAPDVRKSPFSQD